MAFCRLFCMIENCVLSYKKTLIECAKAYFFIFKIISSKMENGERAGTGELFRLFLRGV